jgi:hypothetical protein
METTSTPNPDEPVALQGGDVAVVPRNNNKKFIRPPRINLTSPVNIISFQQDIKHTAQEFSMRTTGAGIRIATHYTTDHTAILSYLSRHNFSHFTLYSHCDKPIKAVIRHLPINTSSQEGGLWCHQRKAKDDQTPLTWRSNNQSPASIPTDKGTLLEVPLNFHP